MATTNARTRQIRFRQQVGAGTNRIVSHACTIPTYTLGTGSGLGGLSYACKFAIADTTIVSRSRFFVGLSSSTLTPANVEPGTLTNSFGVGHGASDTNLKLFYGGSTPQSPIDLGPNFPKSNTEVYLLELFSHPYKMELNYRITRIGTPYQVTGTLPYNNTGLNLPNADTLLNHRIYRATTTVSGRVAFEIGHIFMNQII